MSIELKIPQLGESIQEVQIGRWLKHEGDQVAEDEDVVELETDKASMELPAPRAGVIAKILKQDGESVTIGEAIAVLEENGQAAKADEKPEPAELAEAKTGDGGDRPAASETSEARQSPPDDEQRPEPKKAAESAPPREDHDEGYAVTPSARRALREFNLRPEDVEPSGPQLRREDVLRHVGERGERPDREVARREETEAPDTAVVPARTEAAELEDIVPMSLIRRRIAARLVEAQRNAALLTTFNEIDMSAVMKLRREHRDRFQELHGVKLGFMSFFVKASIDALKQFPELNAEIRDSKIVYRNYYHVGIAIGGERGLVVPVLRHAERMSFADVEREIAELAGRAQENKLKPDELEGGTFTITNGGIYGSLLSTPIVNPPQSGVLGMHAIQDRPVAVDGEVVIRPMMYVALTYDHRIVDGREAVSCLKRIKEAIEDPSRMLIEV
jgi:2-oxoglutarate dehydrogenase E2 component (dihydrolipoamide succinyltransferase)